MEDHAVWLTKRDVAEMASVSVRTVERAIASEKLRASKPSGSVRIHRRWAYAWLERALEHE